MALVVAVVACSPTEDSGPDPSGADRTPIPSIARTVDAEPAPIEAPAPFDDPAVDPEAAITAALMLHGGGDVDAALADGLFTRRDLDAARAALADGSLDHLFE